MAMSTADYFRMMQGGVDRTGYADMIPDVEKKEESLEDRLAKLMEAMGEEDTPPEDTPPEDTPPEETGGLSFGGDFLNSALLGLFTPSLPGKIAALTGGMNFSSNFGKDYVDEIKEKVDPENTMGDVSEMDDDFLFGLGKFYKDAAGDDEKLSSVPTFMNPGGLDTIGPYQDGGRVGLNVGGQTQRGGLRGGRRGFGGPPDGGPDNNKNDLMGPGLNTPVDPIMSTYTPMQQPSLIDQVKKYNFLQGVYGDEDDGLSFGYDIDPLKEEAKLNASYSFEDGGRVGLQNGGNAAPAASPHVISNFNQPNPNPLPPTTQGLEPGSDAFKSAIQSAAVNANSRLGNLVSSAVQAMPQQPMGAAGQPSSVYGLGSLLSGMQQSMGPTFRTADFRDSNNDGVDDRDQGVGISPSIPGDESNSGMNIEDILASLQSGMPQAYTPYVSTMPLYDPSTLGTGLPSTAGGYDPYVSYDPYAPVGAFSRPPSNMDTPSFGLTEDQIKEGFSDMDRFSLAAQQAKKKAAEEAARKAAQMSMKGGGGRGPSDGEGPSLG